MGRKTTCCSGEELKRGSWTEEEDRKLFSFVRLHGERDWKSLPQKAGLMRCGKSCRLRWANYLRPGIKRGAFTPEEDETIIRLHADLGNKWATIARHLRRRTDNEIKNHWNTRLKKLVAKNNPPQVVAELELSNNNNNNKNNNNDNINDNNSNNDPLIFSKSSETTTYSSPSSTCCSSSTTTTTTTTTTNNNNNSFAQVLNSIASKTSLINIHRVLNDTGVGSDPSKLSARSSNAIDTAPLGDEIISMEFQSLIEEFLAQSKEFDGPLLDASFEVDFLDEQMGSTSDSYECDL